MKVSLYVRESSTRKYTKAKNNKSIIYPMGTIYVLCYRSTWETIDAKNWQEANVARLRKDIDLMQGWKPTPKARPEKLVKVLPLDAAIDSYLAEIKSGRKKKTHQAYAVALKYFFESTSNKPIKNITVVI
jgi:hypothetical protein